jgi:hypothetical protein
VNRIFKHRPSPAMAVAITAVVISMGGTAVAASHLISGDKLIKRGTLSGNRLRSHTLTGAQINLSRLGQVPDAAHASTADTLPALDWVPLTLSNGWADNYLPGDTRIPAFAVDVQGIVHLRGELTKFGSVSSEVFATMPAPFRPSQTVFMAAALKGDTLGIVAVDPDGTMTVGATGTAAGNETAITSLDGITYGLG